jgi:N-acetylmuramoyl-L-alanine amidase
MIFSFGVTPVDPVREDFQYRDSLVNGVVFEEAPASGQLVVYLADRALQTRVTHIPDQSVYVLEIGPANSAARSGEDRNTVSGPTTVSPLTNGKRKHLVVIDPGHGGTDRGAQVKEGLFEKEITLSVARKLRWILQSRLGVNAVLSRNEDQTVSLEERAVEANAARADLLVSIHLGNWSHGGESRSYTYVNRIAVLESSKEGGESAEAGESNRIQFLPWNRAQSLSLNRSIQLAGLIQAELNRSINGGDASLTYRRAPLKLLSSLAMPAVLVEIGNAREPAFQQAISDDQFQATVALGVFAAIEKYYSTTGDN